MKVVKLAILLLLLSLGTDAFFSIAAADEKLPTAPTANEIALALSPLHSLPTSSPITPADNSCATSCGGQQGSCTKSCPSSKSCSAACADGKAVCSCD